MKRKLLEIYGEVPNSAIVRMPHRRFPGVVVQGDSMMILLRDARAVLERMRENRDEEGKNAALVLVDTLQAYLHNYEKTLKTHNIGLPYADSVGENWVDVNATEMLSQSPYIVCSHKSAETVAAMLQRLSDDYYDSGFVSPIEVRRAHPDKHLFVITFPHPPDFQRFQYFVSYLSDPEPLGGLREIRGYWTLAAEDIPEASIGGLRIMLFLSRLDEEYDNVYGTTEDGRGFKFRFGSRRLPGGVWEEHVVPLQSSEQPFEEVELDPTLFHDPLCIWPQVDPTPETEEKPGFWDRLFGLQA